MKRSDFVRSFSASAAVVFVAVISQQALATSFIERPLPETVRETEQIARGKIGRKSVREAQSADGRRRLYTYYELQLSEVIKGSLDLDQTPQILVREFGGEKDGVGMQVPGAAQFESGEDVVLMLGSRNVDDSYDLRGLMTGKFNIEKDEDGTEYLKNAGVSALTHPVARPYQHLLGSNPAETTRSRVSLNDLREIVRTQASEPPSPSESVNPEASPSVAALDAAVEDGQTDGASPEAPDLQNLEGKKGSGGIPGWVSIAVVATLVSIFFWIYRLVRRK